MVSTTAAEIGREFYGDLGGEGLDGVLAQKVSDAEEAAVFDFINWLMAQNITLVHESHLLKNTIRQADGALWERWKTERNR